MADDSDLLPSTEDEAIEAWNNRALDLTSEGEAAGPDQTIGEALEIAHNRSKGAPQPALPDLEVVAHEIAVQVATSGKTGRIHQMAYIPAKEAALMVLTDAQAAIAAKDEEIERLMQERNEARAIHDIDQRAFLSVFHRAERAEARVAELEKALETAQQEAKVANDVIRLNRDGGGSGRVKVATAMHRIEHIARAALHPEKEQSND